MNKVGLYLKHSQCFSHGQFYTATSRVRNLNGIRICAKKNDKGECWVKNIVDQRIVDPEDIAEAEAYWVNRRIPVSLIAFLRMN